MILYFLKKKYSNINFVDNGGWHFTNIKSPKDIDFKMRNFAHHLEYEHSGVNSDKLKENIEKKTVFYNHSADKTNTKKFNHEIKLEKLDLDYLPNYIKENLDSYKEWLD